MRREEFGIGILLDKECDAVIVAEAGSGRVTFWRPAARMRERIGSLGGRFTKTSELGKGASVTAEAPLENTGRTSDGY